MIALVRRALAGFAVVIVAHAVGHGVGCRDVQDPHDALVRCEAESRGAFYDAGKTSAEALYIYDACRDREGLR